MQNYPLLHHPSVLTTGLRSSRGKHHWLLPLLSQQLCHQLMSLGCPNTMLEGASGANTAQRQGNVLIPVQ